MKLGIDLLDYSTNFNGGKDQFLINLLEGFEKNGFSKNIILFLEFKNKNYLKKIIPGAEIRIVQKKEYLFSKILKRFKIVSKDSEINNFIFKSFFYRKIKYKFGVVILFFPKRKTRRPKRAKVINQNLSQCTGFNILEIITVLLTNRL